MEQDDRDYTEFLSGDMQGFERLVLRHKDPMIYFIERFGPGFADAEDLAQDVFVEVLLHKERYLVGKGFKTYLFTIAHNKAVDWVRRQKRVVLTEEIPEDGQALADSATVESHVLAKERRQELAAAVKKLKREEQQLVFLADVEELHYKEIAAIMDMTLPQTKVRIHRTRKKLREILGKEGLTI